MALIEGFERAEVERQGGLHKARLRCKYLVVEKHGRRLLQLNTYGADDAGAPGKFGQTIQLDTQAAHELFHILKREFSFFD